MKCLRCNNEFVQTRITHKFCSRNCRLRYNSRLDWLKKRDDPNYKDKKKENSKKWYLLNKKKHNERMRIYMRKYYRDHYSKAARDINKPNSEEKP